MSKSRGGHEIIWRIYSGVDICDDEGRVSMLKNAADELRVGLDDISIPWPNEDRPE